MADDGWCIECGDEFHYDDCGGYNPPCACGFHCRSCHEAVEGRLDPDGYERAEESYDDDNRPMTDAEFGAMVYPPFRGSSDVQ